MLQVTFQYQGQQPVFETLKSLHFNYDNGKYISNENAYRATITHAAETKQLLLTFSKELSFDQYKHLHKVVKTIAENIGASVDDHLALMGYLEDGSEAFIVSGWEQWVRFLETAKHVSMEGQKVQVYQDQQLKGEGILLEAHKDETDNSHFRIISCTILSKSGEQVFSGNNLLILATGEF
ncbi:hypothetical protein DS745_18205 [Anaerobacillus alkaliphilus]|uniref:Uncharacterized protein n=1 Tax=Anaerobacillus alkaliphilus TaxID=1548597 RepID=A0A4Q0VPU0_9BACI|nr:hypothetical protein [Anaerobacillus alkaliphilus]RXI98268.1 hypothetical protein DS745_18205 [Anaerobacillus alkaliphilus]